MNGLRTLLGFFGFGLGNRVTRVEKRQDDFSDNVRYADTCDKVHEGLDQRLGRIEGGQGVIQEDIKKLLKR